MKDSVINSYPLMQSYTQPIFVVVAYLVCVLKIGPFLMKNRQSYDLKLVRILYNLMQIVSNTYYVIMGLPIFTPSNLLCTYAEISSTEELPYVVTGHYQYLLLKIADFLETMIFVLRKKNNQVSFLHVFHHVNVFFLAWISFKHCPGGTPYTCSVINSFVHICMYSYYLITVWTDVKAIWWKHYLTMLQMGSQALIILMFIVAFVNPYCPYPKWLIVVNATTITLILYLFIRFYKVSYVSKKDEGRKIKS